MGDSYSSPDWSGTSWYRIMQPAGIVMPQNKTPGKNWINFDKKHNKLAKKLNVEVIL